jgi:hypothetical protein
MDNAIVSKKITGRLPLTMPVIGVAGLHDRRDGLRPTVGHRQFDPPGHTVVGRNVNPNGAFDQIQRVYTKCQTNKPFHPIVPVEKS